MSFAYPLLSLLAIAAPPRETAFLQVAPTQRDLSIIVRSPNQERAVVLIHGLRLHPFSGAKAAKAIPHGWQESNSLLVRGLGRESDVFVFAYGYDGTADEVSTVPMLRAGVARLRGSGLSERCAGRSQCRRADRQGIRGGRSGFWCDEGHPGLRAERRLGLGFLGPDTTERNLFPRFTDEIDAPTGPQGSERPPHPGQRRVCLYRRQRAAGRRRRGGHALPVDRGHLQRQGIPAYVLGTTHWQVVRTRAGADLIAELIRTPQPRWDERHVAVLRKVIFK